MTWQSMLSGGAFLFTAFALCLPVAPASAGRWGASDYSSGRASDWSDRLKDRMRGDDDYERRERRAALREMLADPEGRAEIRAMLAEATRERGMRGGMSDRWGGRGDDMMDRMGDRAGMMDRGGDCTDRSAMRDQSGTKERTRSNRAADRSDDIREVILERLRNDGEVALLIARIQEPAAAQTDDDEDDDDSGDGKKL
ncbi:hypothetical protein KKP04_04600 [Rhodomicrobium sp. Az07]|uniref:hypothetical protein n=1 Tax=Rhodomicrobium sp. Az07 TaxID=2839034 RepID=UPI001BEA7FF4|nr:hypothetical protein [Rhodomicrobium sp. Az07]MBT3070148.1 hypothetical protein [Rhodomicrobium sp. Az07]